MSNKSFGDSLQDRIMLKMVKWAKKIYDPRRLPPPPNLLGDRDIEYGWIASRIPRGTGRALDFGCGDGPLGLIAALAGYDTVAVDLTPITWNVKHPRLRFLQGDVLKLPLDMQHYDIVLNCSAIEHVGLSRYGDDADNAGDLKAMSRIRDLLRPGGIMLLTIPVGRDAVCGVHHRIYGNKRMPQLLRGFSTVECEFYVKNDQNKWIEAQQDVALEYPGGSTVYAIGCFILRKDDNS